MPDTVEEWQQLKKELSRDRFIARFAHPFLVRAAAKASQSPGDARSTMQMPRVVDDDWQEGVAFQTGIVDVTALSPKRPTLRGAQLLRVVKAPGNPFPDRISVGRAANCDIVIKDPTVSKLHAHFRGVHATTAELVDARSHNGTKVNGRPLAAGEGAKVVNGDLLIFGGVVVEWVEPGRLWDML